MVNMSKAIFLCRFQKGPNDPVFKEIEESLTLRSVIENDFDKDKERSLLMSGPDLYDYSPILLDMKDICSSNMADALHTSVRLYNALVYTLKIPFESYLTIYQQLVGSVLHDFTSTDFNEPIINEPANQQSELNKNGKASSY